jgi:hypothetical protein
VSISTKLACLFPLAALVVGCGQKNSENSAETEGEITKYQSGWINKKNNVEIFFGLSQEGNADRVCFYSAKYDQKAKDQNGKPLVAQSDLSILKTSAPLASEFISVGVLKKSLAKVTQNTASEIVRVSSEQTQCNYLSKYLTPKEYNLYTGMFYNGTRPDLFTSVRDCKNYTEKLVEVIGNDPDTGAVVKRWVRKDVFNGTFNQSCIESQIVVLCQADKRVQIEALNNTLSSVKASIELISNQAALATSASKPVTVSMLSQTQGVSTSSVSTALARFKADKETALAFGGKCPAPKY